MPRLLICSTVAWSGMRPCFDTDDARSSRSLGRAQTCLGAAFRWGFFDHRNKVSKNENAWSIATLWELLWLGLKTQPRHSGVNEPFSQRCESALRHRCIALALALCSLEPKGICADSAQLTGKFHISRTALSIKGCSAEGWRQCWRWPKLSTLQTVPCLRSWRRTRGICRHKGRTVLAGLLITSWSSKNKIVPAPAAKLSILAAVVGNWSAVTSGRKVSLRYPKVLAFVAKQNDHA